MDANEPAVMKQAHDIQFIVHELPEFAFSVHHLRSVVITWTQQHFHYYMLILIHFTGLGIIQYQLSVDLRMQIYLRGVKY